MNKKHLMVQTSFIFLLFIIGVSALEPVPSWETTCLNSTHIRKSAVITAGTETLNLTQEIKCAYGCNEGHDVCWRWPGDAIPGEYLMMFEAVALLILFVGLYRIDSHMSNVKIFDVAISLLAVILFFVLALQANNVIDTTTGEGVRIIFVVWFNYGMGVFSLIPFFVAMFKFVYKGVT